MQPPSTPGETIPPPPAALVIPDGPPRRGAPWSRALAHRVLALFGWRVIGAAPPVPRFVLVVAPHTSNWDFPIAMLAMFATGLRIHWLGKHSIFFFPAAPILRWLGGEPIDRSRHAGTVEQSIARFARPEPYILGIAPEGTRRAVAEWKTGFWRVADGAKVPIVPVRFDYSRRVVELTAAVATTGDAAADITAIRRRYAAAMARRPAQFVELPPPVAPPP